MYAIRSYYDALDHVGEARDVGADVARGVGVDHAASLGDLPVFLGLADDLVQIVADGLGEAGRVHRDDFRITSYNVCYTKLLRFGLGDRQAAQALNVCLGHALRTRRSDDEVALPVAGRRRIPLHVFPV